MRGHQTIIISGRQIELYTYERQLPERRRAKIVTNRGLKASFRTGRSLSRARQAFVRLVTANLSRADSPAFITLTFSDVVGIGRGTEIFTSFIKRFRRETDFLIEYVAVPEFQQRGSVHFHCLVWGIPNEIIKNERNTRYIQNIWARGFVDCLATDGDFKIAGYMAKYMYKAMSDARLRGKKAYFGSRGLVRPVRLSGRANCSIAVKAKGLRKVIRRAGNIPLTARREFDTLFLGRCVYKRVNSSI